MFRSCVLIDGPK
jgi:hypothetical protein